MIKSSLSDQALRFNSVFFGTPCISFLIVFVFLVHNMTGLYMTGLDS